MINATGTLKRGRLAPRTESERMFAGTVESLSHEGGLLVSFTGSSPALESIIVNLETGDYIGKVDAVLGLSLIHI